VFKEFSQMAVEVSAKDVMGLRNRTGMGMMECKAALAEAGGDVEKAVQILREKAKGKMDERLDRAASQGTLATARDASGAVMIELNTETDFVARGDEFRAAADKIAQHALKQPAGPIAKDDTITTIIDDIRVTSKENASFARGLKIATGPGEIVGFYIHHDRQKGALVKVSGGPVADDVLSGLAQHVVVADGSMLPAPVAPDAQGMDQALVAQKRNEFIEEAKASGKPADIAEKMSTGKLNKWIDDNTLAGQAYVKDMTGKTKVRDVLPKGTKILQFVRFQVGVGQ
jgi:elongation factor Ts